MKDLTFNDLPQAVMMLQEKLESIEDLLFYQSSLVDEEANGFLTVHEAAAFLNLAIPTIYGLVRDAKIPVYKRGRRLYFSKIELLDWIKEGRIKTAKQLDDDAVSFLANQKWGSN